MAKKIPLVNSSEYAIIDDDDYWWVSQYTWFARKEKNGGISAWTRINGKDYEMGQLVLAMRDYERKRHRPPFS